jgi:hypothetical protein
MEVLTKMFNRAREWMIRSTFGQTMTEYSLILAAIAVVVYDTYRQKNLTGRPRRIFKRWSERNGCHWRATRYCYPVYNFVSKTP